MIPQDTRRLLLVMLPKWIALTILILLLFIIFNDSTSSGEQNAKGESGLVRDNSR